MANHIVIIGAGPAGEAAAKALRRLGGPSLQITVVEKEKAGGLCLNKGCIPSKSLLEQVRKRSDMKLPISWADLQPWKTTVVDTLRTHLESTFKKLKINWINGTAQFKNASTLLISTKEGEKTLPFDKAIIATGTDAFFPPPFDALRSELLDSDKMLEIAQTPSSIIVVGGGAVGCEFACLLNAAGSRVTIIEMTEGLLPGEDAAVVSALTRSFEERGIAIKTGIKVDKAEKISNGWSLRLSDGSSLESDKVLVCVGRVPSVASLGLENAGIKAERMITINDEMQTTNPHIYAVGDVAGTRLAHAAAAQAEAAAANALGGHQKYDDRFVPRCLYSWPEVASVGAWKHQFEKDNRPVKTARAFFQGSAKALAAEETEGFVQIVIDPANDHIAGAQIIGPHATELIHIFSVAMKKEMTAKELSEVMFAHPTLSEVIKEAAKK